MSVVIEPQVATTTRKIQQRLVERISSDAGLALLCAGAALVLNLFRLGSPSLWMDESFSVALARAPYSVLFGAFTGGGEPNMLVYHLLLHVWLQVTGWLGLPASEALVRLPSALFATLSAPIVFLLGRRLFGRIAGFAAAVVFLLNPLELTYAQQTRSYALQVLLVCIAWYALLAALTPSTTAQQRPRWWVLFTVTSALAVYAHAFTLLILLAQVTAFVLFFFVPTSWRDNVRQSWWSMGLSLASIFILIAPLLYFSRSGSKTGWLPAPNIAELASHYSNVVASRSGHLALGALAGLIVVVVLGIASYLLLKRAGRLPTHLPLPKLLLHPAEARPQSATPAFISLLTWFLVPIIVSYVISQGPTRLFSTRYLVVVVPAACLLVGFAISLIRVRAGQVAAAGALICIALVFVPSYYTHAQVEDWRGPTRWLEQQYQPGDGLVCYNNVQGCQLAVNYYLVTDQSAASFANSPGAIQFARFGHGDPFADFIQALDPQALSAFAATHQRLFFIAGRLSGASDTSRVHAVEAWLACRYHLVAQTSSAVVTIQLYATNAVQTTCTLPQSTGG